MAEAPTQVMMGLRSRGPMGSDRRLDSQRAVAGGWPLAPPSSMPEELDSRSKRASCGDLVWKAMWLGRGVPKTLTSLEGFHMVGQWVAPGGGLPPAVSTGRHVIQMLCKVDGKRFTATEA